MTASDISLMLSVLALIISGIAALNSIRDSRGTSRESRRIASMDILRLVDQTRPDRYIIRSTTLPERPDGSGAVDWEKVEPIVKDSFDRVARTFDTVGVFDRLHLVSHEFTDIFHATSCHELWTQNHLDSFVEWRRRDRPFLYWELVNFHERTKEVWDNHPANCGTTKWPRNPRKSRRLKKPLGTPGNKGHEGSEFPA